MDPNSTAKRVHVLTGSGGVMFWATIVGNELYGLFRVADRVKMTA